MENLAQEAVKFLVRLCGKELVVAQHKTKEEAEAYLVEATRKRLQKFCPMIKAGCRKDCVCYRGGGVSGTTSFFSYPPYCTSPMIEKEE
jgi:hypothetical protein